MKISIGTPPIEGNPQISQNRQFQWYRNKTRIYPVIHASAATMLSQAGHTVIFDPRKFEPADIVLWEVKTPIVRRAWYLVKVYKMIYPKTRFILCGDHVTALPQESRLNCPEAEVLVGGDFDVSLYKLVLGSSHGPLPVIDRDLTRWRDYAHNNGNFTYRPGAYTMFGRDCWYGKCTFCSWASLYPTYSVCSVEYAIKETINCHKIGAKEIFDDSGTFPRGEWLRSYTKEIIAWRGRTRKAPAISCNARINGFSEEEYHLLKMAGFHTLLFGVESLCDRTLRRLRKGFKSEDVSRHLRMAKKFGFNIHATFLTGFPWETEGDIGETVKGARELFRGGLIDSLQATVVMPYPNTPLWAEAAKEGWLKTQDWDRYDMQEPILKCSYDPREYVRKLYKACLTPRFIARNMLNFRKAWYWRSHL